MAERIDVFISSTSLDLPTHRKEAIDACLRMGMFPIAMEQLPASDANAVSTSLKMCDDAEIYLGIFANRYGYIPSGYDVSITEIEYNRATERGIPRLIFIMHDEHPIKGSEVEKGEGAVKLQAFKNKLLLNNIVNFFKSPEDLRGQIIHSLVPHRTQEIGNLHPRYASDIPFPPEPYIAHPYTLLQTGDLVGRKKELSMLTEWAKSTDGSVYNFIVAIGGMGKSALTWKWFNDTAVQVIPSLAGRMWWSFYESDARFENFVARALAYVSRRSIEEVEILSRSEQELQLLGILDKEAYLIVLDGLERIMLAYARMDAARMMDDDLDERTANYSNEDIPDDLGESFASRHHLRKAADPRIGAFLRKLTHIRKSKILVTSRLYPAELQAVNGEPVLGSRWHFLRGLEDGDAINLWYSFGMKGATNTLLPVFNSFNNYPLLVRALAGEVANYRRAPGDFDRWRVANPRFDPFSLPVVQVTSHVLGFALQSLSNKSKRLLHTIAAFRMPAVYDTLAALLVNESRNTIFDAERDLDAALSDLENRGLVGWDKRSNRYDVHPVVRGIVWRTLEANDRSAIYQTIYDHFESVPLPKRKEILVYEDLTIAIELFNSLIGLGKFDEAHKIYQAHLYYPLLHKLGLSQKRVELVEMFFAGEGDKLPKLSDFRTQLSVINDLGFSLKYNGQPQRAIEMFRRIVELDTDQNAHVVALRNLADALIECGQLRDSAVASRSVLKAYRARNDAFRQAIVINIIGLELAIRGETSVAEKLLLEASSFFADQRRYSLAAYARCHLAQCYLWTGKTSDALLIAKEAHNFALKADSEHDFIRSLRLQGTAERILGEHDSSQSHLYSALVRSRSVSLIEEELPALIALAKLATIAKDYSRARSYLSEIWDTFERGTYPLQYADGLNVLAQIEYEVGDYTTAGETAIQAYRSSWCDGPPYAYHWGLETAKQFIGKLGVSPPVMPPYNPNNYAPVVEIDLNIALT